MNKKIIVYVPLTHADKVREAIAQAGGGKLGTYTHCTFSMKGVGRFKPQEGANPHIGKVGVIETVEEERIEVTCSNDVVDAVVKAIRGVHPYEEIAFDVYSLDN
jgi:hypothetical protein